MSGRPWLLLGLLVQRTSRRWRLHPSATACRRGPCFSRRRSAVTWRSS